MATAAVVVFAVALRGTNQGDTATFVVASHPLQAGAVIEPGDLTTASLRMPYLVAAVAFGSPTPLLGRTLAVPATRGELLEASMLVPSGQAADLRPVTVAADPASLAGLYAGEPVDVLQTTGTDASTAVTVVVRGATLISLSQPGSGVLSANSTGSVTLGVASLAEVEAVVAAAHSGTLTIVMATPADGVGPGPGATPGQ